jgi:hypothetical protein
MFRTAIFASSLLALAAALFSAPAAANEYYYGGGYAPYPPHGGYAPYPPQGGYAPAPSPYVGYVPGPSNFGQPRLPPPPILNLREGARYYRYSGYGAAATPCYDQYVRLPDGRGGWAWGLKSGCDPH